MVERAARCVPHVTFLICGAEFVIFEQIWERGSLDMLAARCRGRIFVARAILLNASVHRRGSPRESPRKRVDADPGPVEMPHAEALSSSPSTSEKASTRATARSAHASASGSRRAGGMRVLLATMILGMAALADAQTACEDTRSTRKCMRKIARKGWSKCSRPRFQQRCRATCNTWDSTICSGTGSQNTNIPRPGIANACGCTVYRGVSANSATACAKSEYFNGEPSIICSHSRCCQHLPTVWASLHQVCVLGPANSI